MSDKAGCIMSVSVVQKKLVNISQNSAPQRVWVVWARLGPANITYSVSNSRKPLSTWLPGVSPGCTLEVMKMTGFSLRKRSERV